MAVEILTTLHPDNEPNVDLYPNIKRDNIPNGAVNNDKLGGDVQNLLSNIGTLRPSGVDTSAHILAFTYNRGIWIASDNGKWYYWNGTQYAEGGTYLSDVTNSIKPYPVGDYNDCNLVPVNSIITITISNPYSNTPSGESEGTLLTFNQYLLTPNSSGSGQIFISKNNKFYSRVNWNGWKSWVNVSLDKNIMQTYNPSNYNNASLVPVNSIMTITGGYSNLPSGESEGTLLTFNQYQLYDGGIGSTQLFISKTNKFYTRLFWGSSWTGWVNLNGIENKNHYEDYIYAKYEFNNKTSLWCGDSIIHGETSGAVVVDEPVVNLFSNYCNMNFTNIAVGGAKIVGSSSDNSILKQLTDTTYKDVDYLFIGAGVNDFLTNTNLTDVKNALIDIMDYIVNNFASKTKVFFITPINYYGTATGNNTLNNYRDIINETIMSYDNDRFNIIQGYKFNFPLYDNNAAFKSLISNDGIHPTQLGYKTAYLRGLIKSLIL